MSKFKVGQKVQFVDDHAGCDASKWEYIQEINSFKMVKVMNQWWSEEKFKLMPEKFIEGQVVVCIKSNKRLLANSSVSLLIVGGLYTITSVSRSGTEISVDGCWWPSRLFGVIPVLPHIESKKEQMKNMKFKISDAEYSKQVQAALFNLGYVWLSTSYSEFDHTNKDYLFAHADGAITWSYSSSDFNREKFIECYIDAMGGIIPTEHVTTPGVKGLESRSTINQHRITDILNAMMRYHTANKSIPQPWIDELEELNAYSYSEDAQ